MFWEKPEKNCYIAAIIAAAGSSSRMGGVNKMFELLDDIEIIEHSIMQFEDCGEIDEIIIVARAGDIPRIYDLSRDYGKVSKIVAGGATRQQSVFNAIKELPADTDYFVIHDGARPLVDEEIITNCINAAKQYGAAIASVPCKDTVKQVAEDGRITATPDRRLLYSAQTPQSFDAVKYRAAMLKAQEANADFTDDAQLFEFAGYEVHCSQGSYSNIKITTFEDLIIAQTLYAVGR